MNARFFAALAACGITACATNSGPVTSWGKEGVSMLDYRADGILCAGLTEDTAGGNRSNTAGGINGQNSGGAGLPGVDISKSPNAAVPVGGGGVYREGASTDFANRAAMQQQQAEMARLKARKEAMQACLVKRGYTEFRLTPEERAKLLTLPEGSDERRQFLYGLATNPDVLKHATTR